MAAPLPAAPSFADFAQDYRERFARAAQELDLAALERIAAVFSEARERGATVFFAGNGGSAAIANHSECDASKGTFQEGRPLLSRSLSSNTSLLTALGNDVSFEDVFAQQVRYFGKKGDVLVLVSSSGSSPNVLTACRAAREMGLLTVALVGFDGGALKQLADLCLHVPVRNYGIVEDCHQACIHVITQWLCELDRP
ncbi:MAG: SIS domain-containing protein [Myxococcales bacterium]|nr:SIS domain-containing protein [Myxococcales bacterium]